MSIRWRRRFYNEGLWRGRADQALATNLRTSRARRSRGSARRIAAQSPCPNSWRKAKSFPLPAASTVDLDMTSGGRRWRMRSELDAKKLCPQLMAAGMAGKGRWRCGERGTLRPATAALIDSLSAGVVDGSKAPMGTVLGLVRYAAALQGVRDVSTYAPFADDAGLK